MCKQTTGVFFLFIARCIVHIPKHVRAKHAFFNINTVNIWWTNKLLHSVFDVRISRSKLSFDAAEMRLKVRKKRIF